MSAGIKNTIEEFLKRQQCYYDNIYIISNEIEFKEDNMQEFTGTILHSMNKKLEGNLPQNLQNMLNQKECAVLCGDIIEDVQMVNQEDLDKTITIGFLNSRESENLRFYQENYDIVLTKEDACFQEVENIINLV